MIEAIESYLTVRRTAGFRLRETEVLLRSFAAYAAERGDSHVQVEAAIAWAGLASSSRRRECRLNVLTLFARYIHAEDSEHQIPPTGVFAHGPRIRRLPHIYTPSQLCQILEAAGQLRPTGSLRPHTYRILFGLLAACGLRISEALALRLEDIRPDGLLIRDTKFRKSRLVPLHPTTAVQLTQYLHERQRLAGAEERVFVSLRRKPLKYVTVNQTFLFILRKLGLRKGPGEPGPRLHDIRHSFAVRVLENSPDGRTRIGKHMLALSTYLRHARVTDTYWYLQATPQLMTDIADLCEAHLEGGQP